MTVHSWFDQRIGTITYSMNGSRNGADGTADCSGSISQALINAGYNVGGLLSTVTLGSALKNLGFTLVTVNGSWDGKEDDIILMSWGADMSTSGGAGGHVGILHSPDNGNTSGIFESTDYWTNGQTNTAISRHNIDEYLAIEKPSYYEVWRKPQDGGNAEKPANNITQNQPTMEELKKMQFIFTYPNAGTYYFDGATIFGFTTSQQLDLIKGVYKQTHGKDIPAIQWTEAQYKIWNAMYPYKAVK